MYMELNILPRINSVMYSVDRRDLGEAEMGMTSQVVSDTMLTSFVLVHVPRDACGSKSHYF